MLQFQPFGAVDFRRGSCSRPRRSRVGFLYVAVLFTSVLVMAVVAAALTISTSRARSQIDRGNRSRAIRLAESELHRLAALIDGDLQWRSVYTNNVWSGWQTLRVDGSGQFGDALAFAAAQFRHRFYDRDGDLSDDSFDAVELTVHVRVGRSEAALAIEVQPDPKPLDLLDYAVTALDDLELEGGTLATSGAVQVGDDCKARRTGLLTTPLLECSGRIEFPVRGDLAAADVQSPPWDVVERYVRRGTEIPTVAIPWVLGSYVIDNRVISAAENPFGDVDPSGIYWIDAQGESVVISDSHLKATLAIKNAVRVCVAGSFVWHYPYDADVILATDSRIEFTELDPLLEEAEEGTRFNTPLTPYRDGTGNQTLTDVFPTELRGIVYTSGRLEVEPMEGGQTLRIQGALIGRDIELEGNVSIVPLPELIENPPLGFSDPAPIRFVRGTMRQVATP